MGQLFSMGKPAVEQGNESLAFCKRDDNLQCASDQAVLEPTGASHD
jgi:hypothetical protein